MKRLLLSLVLAGAWPLCAQEGGAPVKATTILNADGTRTDIVRNLDERTSETMTYNTAGRLTKRMVFTLNDEGREVEGVIYDGNEKVLSRVSIGYDPVTGKMTEQIERSPAGNVLRRAVIRYDANGRAVGAEVFDGQGRKIEGGGAPPPKAKPKSTATPTSRKRR